MRSTFRSVGALVEGECSNDDRHDGEIEDALVAMHQERCQQEVMDEEEQEEGDELAPHDEDLRPVEDEVCVADRAHIQAQQWGCKEHAPYCQVNQILLSGLLHPIVLFHL